MAAAAGLTAPAGPFPVGGVKSDGNAAGIFALERPDPALWKLYVIRALLSGPGMLVAFPYLYFRYHTLRYRFDEEGIHMKVGILFRREVNLTYARIQDIHLRSGFIQRWLGLADVQVQTASGNAGAELVIEGVDRRPGQAQFEDVVVADRVEHGFGFRVSAGSGGE